MSDADITRAMLADFDSMKGGTVIDASARRPHEPRAHAGFGRRARTRVAGLVPLGAHAGVLHAVGAPATAAQRNWPGRRLDQTGLARASLKSLCAACAPRRI